MAERMKAKTIELASSHVSLISHPQEIAALILEAVAVFVNYTPSPESRYRVAINDGVCHHQVGGRERRTTSHPASEELRTRLR